MKATIELGNAVSRLYAPDEVMSVVRWNVAFQEADLPPVGVQGAIKAWRKAQGFRRSLGENLFDVLSDGGVQREMERAKFDPALLNAQSVESVLRMRGIWDGWRQMVTAAGYFPTGLLQHVERALSLRCRVGYTTADYRGARPLGQPLGIDVPLFDFQAEAVEAFLAAGRGVVDLPPRSGKTRIGIAIAVRLGLPMLWVAPGVGIAKQTEAAFAEFLGDQVLSVTGGRQSSKRERRLLHTQVWIATPKTAAKLPGIKSRRVLVIDEFHHAAAKTWQAVSTAAVGCWWRLGLTGTHFRADGRDMEMQGVLGRSVYQQSVESMVGIGRLVPARIAMIRVRGAEAKGRSYYKDGVVNHAQRNALIAWVGQHLVHRGKRVLVLAKEVQHTRMLADQIPGAVAVDGGDNDAVDRALADLEAGRVPCVVGTSVIGEGRDVPGADALVYACAGRSRVKVTQDYFRVLTASPGKSVGLIVDFADTHGSTLTEHAADRLLLYREEAAFDCRVIEATEFAGWLGR